MNQNKINLVISGGGVRAIYAAGVAQYLIENGMQIAQVSAVSGGSVIGAMLAYGYQPIEILNILKSINFKKITKLSFRGGLFSAKRFKIILDKIFADKTVNQLSIPAHIWAIELQSGDLKSFNQELVSDAILASCALYPIFAPYKIDDCDFIDGGFSNNLPAEIFQSSNCKTIGINLNPKLDISPKKLNLKRLIYTMFYSNIMCRKNLCDIYIEPDELKKISIFDTKQFDKIFELGYEESNKNNLIEAIKNIIK